MPAFTDRFEIGIPAFAVEFAFDTTLAAFNLTFTGALERYPHIRFLLAHAGGTVPFLVGRFDLLWFADDALAERSPKGGSAYMRSLHHDTALSANPHALSSLTELVGTDHILFGSDYPFAPEPVTQMTVDGIARHPFTATARAQVEPGERARPSALVVPATGQPRLPVIRLRRRGHPSVGCQVRGCGRCHRGRGRGRGSGAVLMGPMWRPVHPPPIVDPRSGDGTTDRLDLVGGCRTRGIEPVVLRRDDDLRAVAESALSERADAIGVAGGDGSKDRMCLVASRPVELTGQCTHRSWASSPGVLWGGTLSHL